MKFRARVLEPIDRVSEVLFGLIMVLTFTGSLSVAEAGRDDVRAMLVGALGCNVAWGVIDAMLYLMGGLADKGRGLMTFRAVRNTGDLEAARRDIAAALPPTVASILTPAELESMRQRLIQLPEPAARARLSKHDWLGATGVFLVVFLSTFPVVIPFIVMRSAGPALRVSNGVAIVMLFLTGWAFGRITGHHPGLVGLGDGGSRSHSRRHDDSSGRMSHVRVLACLAIAIVCMDGTVFAQALPNVPVSASRNTPPESDDKAWSFAASVYTYHVPDDTDYAQPTLTADHGWLHLEARYNYEALDTGSAWIGYNFSGGETLAWEFTPMLARCLRRHHRHCTRLQGLAELVEARAL